MPRHFHVVFDVLVLDLKLSNKYELCCVHPHICIQSFIGYWEVILSGRIIPHGCYGVLLFYASVSTPAFKWVFSGCLPVVLLLCWVLSSCCLVLLCLVTRWLGDVSLVVPSPSHRDSCVSSCFDLLHPLLLICCLAGWLVLLWPSGRSRLTACVPAAGS